MSLSLSTRWNAFRHDSGEKMIEEILRLGFSHVELGYDLTLNLVAGVRAMVETKAVTVDSVHNYCPVPVGAPYAHPELFLLGSLDARVRQSAVLHTTKTVRFAAEIGADIVVTHCGNVEMRRLTSRLLSLLESGKQGTPRYEKTKVKAIAIREKRASRHFDQLCRALEELLPVLDDAGVRLGLENLPSWESIPTEAEMEALLERFDSPSLCYWHDIGHGYVRDRLGFTNYMFWVEKLKARLGGMHVHDVVSAGQDHVMPPHGEVSFEAFRPYVATSLPLVLEPAPGTLSDDVFEGAKWLRTVWNLNE